LFLAPWYSQLLASPEWVDWAVCLARAVEVVLASRASHPDYHPAHQNLYYYVEVPSYEPVISKKIIVNFSFDSLSIFTIGSHFIVLNELQYKNVSKIYQPYFHF
jgi:hypothetical protein